MARAYFICPTSALRLEILERAVVSSLESLRLNGDKSEAVVKVDEKEVETIAALEKLGFQKMTAEECRTVVDGWQSPDTPLDLRACAEIVIKSSVSLTDIRARKPLLVSSEVTAEIAKIDVKAEPEIKECKEADEKVL
jgi:hypothetical protein